jgi:hypothetical protein
VLRFGELWIRDQVRGSVDSFCGSVIECGGHIPKLAVEMLRTVAPLVVSGLVLVGCSRPTTINRHLDRLYLSAREVDGAISTGVPFDVYAQKVAAVASELLIAQDVPTDGPARNAILAKYAVLIDDYRSALYVWEMGIQNARGDDARLIAIQQKYLIVLSDESRRGKLTLFEDIRDQLWERAAATEKEIVPMVLRYDARAA